jgi:hypothetical protein
MKICVILVFEQCAGGWFDGLTEETLTERDILGYRAGRGLSHEASFGLQDGDIIDSSICIGPGIPSRTALAVVR